MSGKQKIPGERPTDADAKLLAQHYGKPVPEAKLQRIMAIAEQQRETFKEAEQQKLLTKDKTRSRGR